ncbi:hypothetical protein ABZ883_40645 [Streptomyces sp. NPDC046977]|uniref:hypothetical protein n=1 Tax=Streptomyces sp. NPDC046977 TaxID=3154703 RepID=UPI0033DDE875
MKARSERPPAEDLTVHAAAPVRRRAAPLPADRNSAFVGAVALPMGDKPLVAHVIEATEESSGPKGADQ